MVKKRSSNPIVLIILGIILLIPTYYIGVIMECPTCIGVFVFPGILFIIGVGLIMGGLIGLFIKIIKFLISLW